MAEIRKMYARGENIMRLLGPRASNTPEAIMISYDLQTGTYIENCEKNAGEYEEYASEVGSVVSKHGTCASILEAGVGEGTTFLPVLKNCGLLSARKYGFDISWSRAYFAAGYLRKGGIGDGKIFVGDLSEIPLADDSMDFVYTSHAVEPNTGREAEILKELYRVAGKYLFLFEPDYGLATREGKERMDYHGYVKDLFKVAQTLGYEIVDYSPLKTAMNKLNPTSVLVIRKEARRGGGANPFSCPVTKTPLVDLGEIYFSREACLMYPVIKNIPCLLGSHAILGSKYETVLEPL